MKISVRVKTNAKTDSVEELNESATYKVSVKASPIDGEANDAVIKLLAKHFKIKPYDVQILSGHTSKQKLVEIS